MAGAEFTAAVDAQVRVYDAETGGSSGQPVDVALLPDKSRVERGVDPDSRWHLEGPSTGAAIRTVSLADWAGTSPRGALARLLRGEVRALPAEHREPLQGQDGSARGDPQVGDRALRRGSRVPRGDRD